MSGAIGTLAIGETAIGGSFVQSYTARDMVNLAARSAGILGVGQTILPQDISDIFAMLNGMLAQWSRRRWLIWHLLDIFVPTTGGQQRYSIGTRGDYDFPRPDRLEAAYFRQYTNGSPNFVDFPLDILQSMEDYSQIALKKLLSWPQAVFYDSAFPIGYIYPVPIPQVQGIFELHVLIKDTLNQFPTVDSNVNLPPEYFEAIWTNLTMRICALYPGAIMNELTAGLAKASLNTIRNANTQISRLRMPEGMTRPPLYNIYSGMEY